MVADLTDPKVVEQIAKAELSAAVCQFKAFDGSKRALLFSNELQGYTANTRSRAAKLDAYNAAMSGTLVRLTDGSECITLTPEPH